MNLKYAVRFVFCSTSLGARTVKMYYQKLYFALKIKTIAGMHLWS